jgi:hypothetical protein
MGAGAIGPYRPLRQPPAPAICGVDTGPPHESGPAPREPIYEFPGGEMHVRQGAVGIDYVIVNGEVLLDHGVHTGALPGQTLRGPLYRQHH